MYSILKTALIVVGGLIGLWIIMRMIRSHIKSKAVNTARKKLRTATHIAPDVYTVRFDALRKKGARVVVIDVDRTLCKLGLFFRQKKLPRRSLELLRTIHDHYDMYVVLATKSNRHVPAMMQQLGSPPWAAYMIGSKSRAEFPEELMNLIRHRGWNFDPYDHIVMIGDKLTDMGPKVDETKGYLRVLTNPAWGGHDLLLEYFALRRTREKMVLDHFGMRRAKPTDGFMDVRDAKAA